jgi:hypothetical protein
MRTIGMRHLVIIAAVAVVAAASLTRAASATEPGGSTLHAITTPADDSHEAPPELTRDVALQHLVREGYSPTKLVLVGKTWQGVDAKTGHPLKLDARTGKINP